MVQAHFLLNVITVLILIKITERNDHNVLIEFKSPLGNIPMIRKTCHCRENSRFIAEVQGSSPVEEQVVQYQHVSFARAR